MKAIWIPESYASEVRREGFTPVDNLSVMLTHVSEAIRNNLTQLLSYKDTRRSSTGSTPNTSGCSRRSGPAQISYSGLQAVLKALLAERVSIRNLHLILEATPRSCPMPGAPSRLPSMSACASPADLRRPGGGRRPQRASPRQPLDLAFHQSLKRDAKGDVTEFEYRPACRRAVCGRSFRGDQEAHGGHASFRPRDGAGCPPYLRMIIERMFPALPVLSHVEIARGVEIRSLGTISDSAPTGDHPRHLRDLSAGSAAVS